MLLNSACEKLPKEKRKTVQELVKQGFFELGTAEAKEASFKGNWNLTPEEYLNIIRRKAAIAEVTARIGAVIGDATPEEIEDWGKIGRILAMLMNIRDEFIDIFEAKELKNRRDNECLPLPMLYAMRNPEAKKRIIYLLKKKELTDDDAIEVAGVVLKTKEVQSLKDEMQGLIVEGSKLLNKYEKCKKVNILENLLRIALNGL
jgi:geranylgeranyl pyrophosphate synthase